MRKQIRIQSATVNTKLWAFLCDLLVLIASTVVLYFGVLYSSFVTTTPYNENIQLVNEYNDEYNLNLEKGLPYEEYESVLKDFYFNRFPKQIKETCKKKYSKDFSIQHIYNFTVLRLPIDPGFGSYKTQFYSYQVVNGNINVDVPAIKLEGSGRNYEKNMHDIFYNSYNDLKPMLMEYNKSYGDAVWQNNSSECYSRIIAFCISILIFYLIIPLSNKYGSTIFEKVFGLGHINFFDGYLASKWKIIFRPFILFVLPAIGIYFGSLYSIVMLVVAPIFLMELPMVISKNNQDLQDILLRMEICFVKDSLLFRNEDEEKAYINSKEFKQIDDINYMDKLSNLNEIDLSVSRSDKISKENISNKKGEL